MEETSSKTLALVSGPGSKPTCKTQPESFSEDSAILKKGLPEIDKLAQSTEDPVGNVLLTTAAQFSELANSNTILTQPVPTDMVISPKKKINRKWKRSARESSSQQIQGRISSPIKKAQILGKIVKKMARDKATSSPGPTISGRICKNKSPVKSNNPSRKSPNLESLHLKVPSVPTPSASTEQRIPFNFLTWYF
ncbi:hypothetical protein LWI29_019738 [Acer saccharum]|uniref:Uncharacterized protein n=1 Tax=Acer saccharum TaxID=4024 RepID=A0AA39VQ45_ACESA|nr:hypothetical protein LWI29_019738 [Acer saccharum]